MKVVCTSGVFSRRSAAGVAAAGLVLTLTACGTNSGSGGKVEGIGLVSAVDLTICTQLPYKPFVYKDGGKVVGFDADLLSLLAKDLGVEPKFLSIEWSQITSGGAFAAKKCDIGTGAMTITEERKRAIRISDPYMDATQVLFVKKSSGYRSLADLTGKKVGVQSGTTGQKYANSQAKKYGFTTVVFEDLALLTNNVKSGRVDAGINDNGVLYNFTKNNPDTAVVDEFRTGEQYGFGADRKGANGAKLLAKLNAVLAKAKSDGDYDRLYKKWFGVDRGE
ncbi:ABC transporter substrate-binding protein [Streptomyces sporangiiformans]|uniref:Amino acid ABC transporter substrate-binding protein n=1 Tax=Streptomyces sporangiiformans TaxID=2315329 RepID=A0A505D1S2_9ACTN|nr:ABC transporter substrate-binding protein [Streptomyces sporangiiformans]TPQ18363.1 amino acid ABC transporter substrate-binding protein [Streptomyces sporangiiformans]